MNKEIFFKYVSQVLFQLFWIKFCLYSNNSNDLWAYELIEYEYIAYEAYELIDYEYTAYEAYELIDYMCTINYV